MDVERSDVEVLERDECLKLLSTARIGHLGLHAHALPLVFPVRFALDDRGIVIRVNRGSRLDAPTRDTVVAFEADDMDPPDGRPWSVGVTGLTTDITDSAGRTVAASIPTGVCPATSDDRLLRISFDLVTGRRAPESSPVGHQCRQNLSATAAPSRGEGRSR